MLIYSVLRIVRNCATKQKLWQIISNIFQVFTENFYIVPLAYEFRFSFGGKFKFTIETLNYKKTRPLGSRRCRSYFCFQIWQIISWDTTYGWVDSKDRNIIKTIIYFTIFEPYLAICCLFSIIHRGTKLFSSKISRSMTY